jgi:hypothetical protein
MLLFGVLSNNYLRVIHLERRNPYDFIHLEQRKSLGLTVSAVQLESARCFDTTGREGREAHAMYSPLKAFFDYDP